MANEQVPAMTAPKDMDKKVETPRTDALESRACAAVDELAAQPRPTLGDGYKTIRPFLVEAFSLARQLEREVQKAEQSAAEAQKQVTYYEAENAHIVALTEERDSLRAELAEAKHDAERYRWLRDDAAWHQWDELSARGTAKLDAAIDAAMSGQDSKTTPNGQNTAPPDKERG